jgi:protein-S-isoprenylcysteine O-methyltransferase Ste14
MEDSQSRGVEWVIAQFVLILAILVAPKHIPGLPPWPQRLSLIARILGSGSLVAGALIGKAGFQALGDNLTPLPSPKQNASLVQSGIYRHVRHPIYSALILLSFGWSLLRNNATGLVFSAILASLLDRKATYEEELLSQRFSDYPSYRRRVAKFLPRIY